MNPPSRLVGHDEHAGRQAPYVAGFEGDIFTHTHTHTDTGKGDDCISAMLQLRIVARP